MTLAKALKHSNQLEFENELTLKDVMQLKRILEQQKEEIFVKKYNKEDLNLDVEECSDDVDHANADISNFQKIRFRSRENLYEKKLDEALKRIQSNVYGYCEECGGPIGKGRLLARPTAELCIQCKEEAEREELFNKNYLSGATSSLGQFLSP